jgi:lysophospholipase L1-like esterase
MNHRWWTLLVLAVLATGCTAQTAGAPTTAAPVQPEVVYAAIGASETYGVGANDRYRQAWPQVFYNDVLPASAVLYNFGIPGATTAQALRDEVPGAVAVHPAVVTVWLNVNDLIRGVSPQAYAVQLQQLVHALRRGGRTRVLVANTPDLGQLPAYQACLPNPPAGVPECLIPTGLVPSPDRLAAAVDAYNGVIAQVVEEEGATLVDLHAHEALMGQHPEWLSADGFHPNGLGYVAIARVFEDAYRKIAPA